MLTALSAPAPQDYVAYERDVVIEPDGRTAGRTTRSWSDDRLVSGDSMNDYVEKAPDNGTENKENDLEEYVVAFHSLRSVNLIRNVVNGVYRIGILGDSPHIVGISSAAIDVSRRPSGECRLGGPGDGERVPTFRGEPSRQQARIVCVSPMLKPIHLLGLPYRQQLDPRVLLSCSRDITGIHRYGNTRNDREYCHRDEYFNERKTDSRHDQKL